jgi:hypothetical protein
MEFRYPDVIYFDITDEDSDIYLQKTNEALEYIFTDRGSSGVVYVNTKFGLCIKLIVYPLLDDESIEILTQRYENEVRLQNIASEYGFAPSIHRNFRTRITINTVEYDVYVIVMDYLNPREWHIIPRNKVTKEMIRTFVKKTGLYNDVDPYNHFYEKTNGEGFVMIDYGHVKKCKEQQPKLSLDICSNNMWEKFITGGTKLKKKKNKSCKVVKQYSLRKKKKTLKIFKQY